MMLALSFVGLIWQPYMKTFNIPLEYYGYILSAAGALAIGAPILSHYLAQRFSKPTTYLMLISFIFMLILFSALFINTAVLAAAVIIFLYVAIMLYAPVEGAFFQRFVPGRMRSSLNSFKSTLEGVGGGIAILLVGLFADAAGPKYTLALAGAFIIPSLFCYWRADKQDHAKYDRYGKRAGTRGA
jgi:predicted MFS family arabinose efflux permease